MAKNNGAVLTETRPTIDYPQQNERISSPQYTIRVGAAPMAEALDVSIDQGPWQACRKAAGYWWYDWSGYENGEHEIIARTKGKNGRYLVSQPHEFFVELA